MTGAVASRREHRERPTHMTYVAHVDAFKQALVTHMLQAHRGNRTHAAKALGITRENVGKLIRKYGITVPKSSRGGPAVKLPDGEAEGVQT